MPYVVGFAAQARNGKDRAADHLCECLNELGRDKWKRGSLGFNVKKIFAEHFGASLDFIEEWKVKKENPPGFNGPLRDGLTKIGDGWRDTKNDIWIQKLFTNNQDNLVISDVRYINEALAISGKSNLPYMKEHTGVAVLLWRPGYENDKPSRSEQELMPFVKQLRNEPSGIIDKGRFADIPFDIWLKNDGTLEEWLAKVEWIVMPYVLRKFGVK